MNNVNVRINRATIKNIKNVKNGTINLNNVAKDTFGASIVGVYGQNGSGKTALIWAMELVKSAISGEKIPDDAFYYIHQNSKSAIIDLDFSVVLQDREYCVMYSIEIAKTTENAVSIINERLEFNAPQNDTQPKITKTKILVVKAGNTEELDKCLYGPETRITEMMSIDKQVRQKFLVLQALAKEKNCSFIFNEKTMELLKEVYKDTIYIEVLTTLQFYGRINMFVLNRNSESSFNMNLLPLSMRLSSDSMITKSDHVLVGLGRNTSNVEAYDTICKVFDQINILIGEIVPELKIDVKEISRQFNENVEEQVIFELFSMRNDIPTPLRYESEGIKKILCILSSLIAMYNNHSIFVAIDEMDAGIFEYLLGEILGIINKTGKGQLLFTSHNMRPLEVLENDNIYFTTTNSENKYIQFTGIKDGHNLRTTLLRTIDLGGQKESIYETTSSYQIAKAFRKARSIEE